jgi:lipoprotein-releasing system permease protein
MLVGMSPERINRLMVPLIVRGESGVHMNEVMIGSGLAKRLSIAPGDTLIVYSSDELRETPRVFQCRVGAVIQCGMTSYDESVVVFDRRMLAQWLRIDTSSASSILVTSTNREGVAAQQRTLQQALGPDVLILTYEDSFATVSSWIELQREPIPIILGLISLVAGLTMISTLLIAVVEKSRSIAILITLGLSPMRAGLIFVTRAVAMSVTGSLIGLALAITALVIQKEWQIITLDGALYYVSVLPVSFPIMPMVIVPLASIVLAGLVGVVPMIVAMRVRPAQILRFDCHAQHEVKQRKFFITERITAVEDKRDDEEQHGHCNRDRSSEKPNGKENATGKLSVGCKNSKQPRKWPSTGGKCF